MVHAMFRLPVLGVWFFSKHHTNFPYWTTLRVSGPITCLICLVYGLNQEDARR
jgi:uncharacterized protein (DUF983 family)